MIQGAHPPSSPTPFLGRLQPLIPNTTSPNDRRELHRASSAETESRAGMSGYVSAVGFTTWRRRSKAKSAKSGKSDGSSKKGPGMGMEGTPARRRKVRARGSQSMGMQSTPRAWVAASQAVQNTSSSFSSLPLSSLPDPDETTVPSIPVPPEIASPTLEPISFRQTPLQSDAEDVFGAMTFIAPPLSHPWTLPTFSSLFDAFARSQEASSHEQTTGMEDMTIPVNFPSSEILSPGLVMRSDEDMDEVEHARQALAEGDMTYLDFIMPAKLSSSEANPPGSPILDVGDLTVRPEMEDGETITHEDLSVPLDEDPDAATSGRLMNTISASGKAATSLFVSSTKGSRVKDRISTPYRRSANSQSTGKGGPQDDSFNTSDTHSPASNSTSADFKYEGSPQPCETARIMEQQDRNRLDVVYSAHIGDRDDNSNAAFPAENGNDDEYYNMEASIQEGCRTPPSGSPATYFPLVRGLCPPVPFVPSSQLGTPLVSPRASLITFATTSEDNTPETGTTEDGSPHSRLCPITTSLSHHGSDSKAFWRGASTLAKLMGDKDPY